jgi:hypothetical protein
MISNDPPDYTPPDQLRKNPRVTVKRPSYFKKNGEMRFIGVELPKFPEKPLRGAFIMGCFIFSDAGNITEVPYDPYLYFGQEEASYSARLYTHGWDVFSQTQIILYHCYNPTVDFERSPKDTPKKDVPRRLHIHDVPGWIKMDDMGRQRYDHIMGHTLSNDPKIIAEIEKYGMGTVRTLEEYQEFCGINYKTRVVSEKGFQCGFVEDFHKYHPGPIKIPPPLANALNASADPEGQK